MSHAVFERSIITPLITIGTNQCCDVHARELAAAGYAADIDLEAHRHEPPPETSVYLRLPTVDGQAPSPAQLATGVAALRALIDQGQRVYVHCHNGHGRSPMLVVAYFTTQGDTVDTALERIRTKRPEIHLNETQHAALEHFARSVRV